MTKEEESTLKAFETRVRQLIMAYRKLQEENLQLQKDLDAARQEAEAGHADTAKLREAYERLKLAKMMQISNDDLKAAKARIDKLVRSIDKSIALLGV